MVHLLFALTSWCRHQWHAVPVPGDVGFREAVASLTRCNLDGESQIFIILKLVISAAYKYCKQIEISLNIVIVKMIVLVDLGLRLSGPTLDGTSLVTEIPVRTPSITGASGGAEAGKSVFYN